jgi:translation initiation factor 2B subunit (eIF-2B alpha/beta/delta family)
VVVAESRPASEGVGVAERLAEAGLEVTLCTDAAIASLLAEREIDSVLVGADTVRFDGTIVNKTGTRAAALAAANEDVPFLVACAIDKISHDPTIHLEAGDPEELYTGPADLEVVNPTFDLTPASLVDGYLTDRGRLASTDIDDIANELASLADWQEQE